MKNILISSFFILINLQLATAQIIESEEQSMQIEFEKLKFAKTDISKDSLNAIIVEKFKKILENEKSFLYDFKRLTNISILKSDDNKLKIYNWNLAYSSGEYQYFGFLQYYNKKQKKYIIFQLKDDSKNIQNPKNKTLSPNNWYGALYYKIKEEKYKKHTQYILLGWDGNDDFTNKKIIEILYFDKNNLPFFGEQVFNYENKTVSRIIFEYAEQAKMLLNYDPNYKMIIWDHLSPSLPELKDQFQYYGPDFSYDGIFFNKGIWEFYSNINVTNSN